MMVPVPRKPGAPLSVTNVWSVLADSHPGEVVAKAAEAGDDQKASVANGGKSAAALMVEDVAPGMIAPAREFWLVLNMSRGITEVDLSDVLALGSPWTKALEQLSLPLRDALALRIVDENKYLGRKTTHEGGCDKSAM